MSPDQSYFFSRPRKREVRAARVLCAPFTGAETYSGRLYLLVGSAKGRGEEPGKRKMP